MDFNVMRLLSHYMYVYAIDSNKLHNVLHVMDRANLPQH